MESKEILKLAVLIVLCMISESSCCEEERFVVCHRPNMTCLKLLCFCRCSCHAPVETYYHRYVKCSNVTEVPKEIPNEAEQIIIVGNNITTLKRGDFSNRSRLFRLSLNNNKISHIEPGSFVNLTGRNGGLTINLENNNLSRITSYMFRDISIHCLHLGRNPITVIEQYGFLNLPSLQKVFVNPFLIKIETEAFVNLSTTPLSLFLTGNNISVIEKNAFVNVKFEYLTIGMGEYFKMKENRFITITSVISLYGDYIQCDCDLMWLVYLRHDKLFYTSGPKCANNNKTVYELDPGDFNCIYNAPSVHICNTSKSVDLPCEYNYLTTNLTRWIHSRNGKFIRELSNDFVDENTKNLHFSFCDHEDSGEYTCMLTTDYSSLPSINRSLEMLVNGPPIVLNQHIEDKGVDVVLSIMFYSIPYEFNLQWFLGNNNLNGDPQYTVIVNKMTGVLKQYNVDVTTDGFISNLTIHNFKSIQSAVYSCKISNSYGLVVEKIVSGPANIELQRRTYCNTSKRVELKCTLELIGATPVLWIHSNAGEIIRALQGMHVNNSYILTIPFCNSQDTGDYTCRWETDIPNQAIMEKSTTLSVSGPPFVISHSIFVEGSDTVLSVSFFSQPFPNDPTWYYNNEPVALGSKFLQTTTYSTVKIRLHRVVVNQEGFISNLTVHEADFGLYKCVILNSFGQVHQLFVIEQEQTEYSLTTTEATRSLESPGNSTTVIIAIFSSVFGVAIVVICIIIFIRRISSDRYNNTVPARNEDNSYDSINMTTPPNMPDNQQDYLEVF